MSWIKSLAVISSTTILILLYFLLAVLAQTSIRSNEWYHNFSPSIKGK